VRAAQRGPDARADLVPDDHAAQECFATATQILGRRE
jgi:hypothetical protein